MGTRRGQRAGRLGAGPAGGRSGTARGHYVYSARGPAGSWRRERCGSSSPDVWTLDLPTGSQRRGGTWRGPLTDRRPSSTCSTAEFGVETPAFTQARTDWESAPQMARGPVRSSAVAPTRLISDPGRGGGRGPRASCARQVYSGPVCSSGPVGGPELGRGPDGS